MMRGLEVIVLSGFLGSGKTTLLVNHLASADTRDTAVIVNEVGQIDVDGTVVNADATVPAILLTNGCICCSMGSDLLDTIEQLQVDRVNDGKAPFGRMIIECSGLSKPGPIIRSLRRLPVPKLNVQIVTLFDIIRGSDYLDQHEEVAAQLAAAHAIVLTKTDMGSEDARLTATELVQRINPLAQLVDEPDCKIRASRAFEFTNHHGNIDDLSMLFSQVEPVQIRLGHRHVNTLLVSLNPDLDWDQISNWLEDLASFCGDRLLRLKGFVQPSDSKVPVLVQSVGTVFSTPFPMLNTAPPNLGLVLITRGIFLPDLVELDSTVVSDIRVGKNRPRAGGHL